MMEIVIVLFWVAAAAWVGATYRSRVRNVHDLARSAGWTDVDRFWVSQCNARWNGLDVSVRLARPHTVLRLEAEMPCTLHVSGDDWSSRLIDAFRRDRLQIDGSSLRFFGDDADAARRLLDDPAAAAAMRALLRGGAELVIRPGAVTLTFRTTDVRDDELQEAWRLVLAVYRVLTPAPREA